MGCYSSPAKEIDYREFESNEDITTRVTPMTKCMFAEKKKSCVS
jgi:hypothetical protein